MSNAKKKKAIAPDKIQEEFYQITMPIYTSFSRYKPPLDLFILDEASVTLYPYSKKGDRLTNEKIEKAIELCENGCLFVSRADLPIYSKHIVNQLDLLLLDSNFKPAEIAEITIRALEIRFTEFYDQPLAIVFEDVMKDLLVLTEFLTKDKYSIRPFLAFLFTDDYTPAKHAINSLILGLWIYLQTQQYNRKQLDHTTIGLFIHDIGMSKVPAVLLSKTVIKQEDTDKIRTHVTAGVKVLQKIEFVSKEVQQALFEHHERLDGSGYPQKSKDMSEIGKITAIADSVAAMIQNRIYAPKKTLKEALTEVTTMKDKYDIKLSTPLMSAYTQGIFKNIK